MHKITILNDPEGAVTEWQDKSEVTEFWLEHAAYINTEENR